jgi:hypothetical protein
MRTCGGTDIRGVRGGFGWAQLRPAADALDIGTRCLVYRVSAASGYFSSKYFLGDPHIANIHPIWRV